MKRKSSGFKKTSRLLNQWSCDTRQGTTAAHNHGMLASLRTMDFFLFLNLQVQFIGDIWVKGTSSFSLGFPSSLDVARAAAYSTGVNIYLSYSELKQIK